ncbi:protocatechuate 3,4-dioxygenase subunit alpha [Jannaschia marina]|uniref:protocatechuate 3,4-dioxygenase subunit alpha n=1 Tax=Jannaschia marina TaxID=2741674 RepID=UPI0015CB5FA3|nr:protocatechuate 3,4-dioxygenase subunit alpha [Jannaschia marina]
MTRESASQTAGPYLHIGLAPNAAGLPMFGGDLGARMVGDGAEGTRMVLTGEIRDGSGAAVTDALVEMWQADAAGHCPARDPAFTGWGRTTCDTAGRFRFETLRPGALDGQAPHVTLWIAARGIGLALQTRVYFPDAPENATDPVLSRVPESRRDTLIAAATPEGYNIKITLQGADETVFFDI